MIHWINSEPPLTPTPLFTRVGENIPQGRPEPERAIAGREFRRHREAAFLEPAQQVTPAIGVLSKPVHDRRHVLLTILIRADDHQHTLTIAVQARREVDPVGPDVDVAFALQIALAPGLVFVPPSGLQPRDRRGRQPLGIGSQKSGQRLAEIPGRLRRENSPPDCFLILLTLQVQPGQQFLDRLRPCRRYGGTSAERNLILLPSSLAPRSRTRGTCTGTVPIPVMISRSGKKHSPSRVGLEPVAPTEPDRVYRRAKSLEGKL